MKNFSIKRFTASLLFIVMVVAALPVSLFNFTISTSAAEETIYVLAGSDFQPTDSSNTTGVNLLNKILDKVDDKYTTMDGFIFAGDYDYQYKASQAGKEALQGAVQAIYGTEMDEVYIEGNHDDPDHGSNPDLIASGVFNPSGENDTDNYGVFAINHSDYMWYNSDETAIKNIAANLETYLNAKRNAGYTKPIFVVSHLPLHYCMRTKADGDGKHANYIFDVLNEAGAAGLNIIFMFGHNHSHGWDDPYGGAAIFLKKGDSINIAQNSTTNYNVETLNFTYMNAGYVSYYRNVNSGAETDLSMTVFAITGSDVTIERYTADGLHNLKSAGVANTHASTGTSVDGSCRSSHVSGAEPYSPDTTTVASGYVMTLNTEITPVGGESGGEGGNTGSGTATSIEQVTSLEQGVPYIITSYRDGLVLTGTTTTNKDGHDSLLLSGEPSVSTTDLWYYNGTNLIYGDPDSTSTYLLLSTDTAYLGESHSYRMVDNVYLNNDNATFSLKRTDDGLYLNQYGGSGYTAASPYTSDGNSDDGSKWVIYKVSQSERKLASFTDNGVTVTTYDITGLNVTVETKTVDGYSAYKSYDINPENYTQGDEATVDIELDMTIFSANRPVTIIDNGTVIKTANIVDGKVSFKTSHFSVYAVAQASVATSGGDWVVITKPTSGTTTYTYELTDTIVSGESYLIGSGNNGSVNILNSNGGTISGTTSNGIFTTTSSVTDAHKWTFTGSGTSYTIQNVSTDGYLYPTATYKSNNRKWTYSLETNGDNTSVTVNNNSGALTISTDVSAYYGYVTTTSYMTSGFGANNPGSAVYLYEIVEHTGEATPGLYGKVDGTLAYEVKIGTSKEDALAKVKAGITGYTNTTESDPGTPLDDNDLTWTLDSYDRSVPGEYAVNIAYNGVELGVAKVTVLTAVIEDANISSNKGSVERGSKLNVSTGATITLKYDDGTTATVDVTVGMLTGNFDINKNGTYSGLTVTYGAYEFENFTLEVTNVIGNDFPEYPDEGAVKVNKVADATKLQSSGLVNVELSTSGINVTKGADVVVVIDTSSSMRDNKIGTKTRIQVLSESLEQMLTQFKTADSHGHIPDIDIAIIDFNGYYPDDKGTFDSISITNTSRSNVDYAKLFTGSNAGEYVKNNTLSANDFVAATSLTAADVAAQFNNDNCKSGTNYDGALENAYKLLAAKQAANGEEERDSYVIFLSDGAPFRYNGYNNGDSKDTYNTWNNYLSGYWADADALYNDTSIHYGKDYTYFYNGNGSTHPHLYAEAIKGTPGTNYKVVSRDAAGNNPAYVKQVEGLGATIYSIGFGLADDGSEAGKKVTVATQQELIEVISSGADYNYPNVQTAEELDEAFNQIVNAITYAARNAYFVDQMGQSFDLMMGNTVDKRIEGGGIQVTTLDGFTTQIQVLNYNIYSAAQVGTNVNGVTVTDAMVGQRYGDPIVVETITFKETMVATDTGKYYKDANGVYWVIEDDNYTGTRYSKVYTVKSDKLTLDNILVNGIITAKNFWYNTTANTVKIDTNGDGTADYDLLTESFYWNIGTIDDIEWALSYWLYLTGAMEGNAPAGSYKTNESAVLHYINWLGNSVEQGTTSPQTGWESANVSYAFYLVDQYGNPVINQTTGQTGSFYEAVKVTKPVIYQEILLNNLDDVDTIEASSDTILPDGYELYDKEASYKVVILSEDGKGSWTITSGDGKVQSSYVTGYSGTLATNIAKVSSDSNMTAEGYTIESNFDYTHTVIYFALLWIPTAIPDQVVIDYGLPVDISVLGNDQFGNNGTLIGIGKVTDIPVEDGATKIYSDTDSIYFTSADLVLTYGTAKMIAPKVRYTPADMQMNGYDQFAYEVEYNKYEYKDGVASGDPEKQYYYGTVTVIPATTIYYEEKFVDFENGYIVSYDANGKASFPEKNEANRIKPGETYGAWSVLGNYVDKTQEEDRPGQFSLDGIDNNNVYGYDDIYNESTTYSLGSAMQVTVNNSAKAEDGSYTTTGYNGYAPTATFTFTGTGFDIISLTDSDAGMIVVTVKKGDFVKSTIVANYYGMSYDASTNTWTSEPKADGEDTIWQVPVIKMGSDDLDGYGTYTVEIQLVYMTMFDLDNGGAGNGEYNFILDSIRVYDPANGGANDSDSDIEDAYKADNEYNPQYFLIRDMLVGVENGVITSTTGTEDVVFIDGNEAATIAQYANPGPNNEVYLAYGQSIAFNIAVTYPVTGPTNGLYKGSKPVVNLGAKIAYGGTITVGLNADKSKDITTATDMYHTMPLDWAWTIANGKVTYTASVVLTNTTADTVLSLTNIKITENTDEYIQDLNSTQNTAYNARSAGNLFTLGRVTALASETEEAVESIKFYVDQELVDFAASVMATRFAPEPEIIVPTVFVPEALEYTVTNRFFGNSTVNVITSKDVASLTVNGVEAKKLSNSPLFSMLLKLIAGFEGRFGTNISANDYVVWSASVKRASNYDIVAYNADGLSSDPTVTDSSSSITKEDIDNYFNRSELYSIMEQMASQRFDPEQFEAYVNERFDGFREIITQTSEDVEYVIINGKIVDRYITETVIDTETGETTTKRVWITDAEDDVDDEDVEVNAYDEKGVGSESKKAERKFGWKKNSNNNSNNGNSNSASDKNNNNKENNGKGNSGKYGRM